MKTHLRCCRAILLSCLFTGLCSALPGQVPDLKAPLPTDPKIKVLELPNGLTCWVRPHNRPPGKVSLWLHVDSGSVNEEDNQRGLAHFLEHMAFDGTENFPPGTLVKYFESMGMRYGSHQNAFTSFNQTTYTLTLPNTKEETVDKGLLCLSDYAFRMSLLPEEVEKERKVVLEESRARKGARQRMMDKLLPILLPGSLVAERLPIGKEEVIQSAPREELVSYYQKWYRPDNTTLIVVGEVEPALIKKLLPKHFGEWKKADTPATNADYGVKAYTSLRADTVTDPEETEAEVSFVRVRALAEYVTIGSFRRELVYDIGTWIVNRRLSNMIREGRAPFQRASLGVYPLFNVCTYANAEVSGQPEKLEEMLRSLSVETKRARVHGFLAQELEDAKKSFLSSAGRAAQTEATKSARALIREMNYAITLKRLPVSDAQNFELTKQFLPGVTLEEVAAAFRKNFGSEAKLILATLPEKEGLEVPTREKLLALAREAEGTEVKALVEKERIQNLLEREPTPGTVKEQTEEPDLKILSATLSNGARVHLRSMDYKKDSVLVRITLAGGKIRETPERLGVTEAATLAFSQAASETFSSTQISDLMTGKKVSVSGHAGSDALGVSISGTPEDLEEGFRLAHLLLTRPKIEKSALDRWKERKAQGLDKHRVNVRQRLWEGMGLLLSGDDARFRVLTKEEVNAVTLEAAQSWLEQLLRSAPIEASIVGDIDRDRALALALKYLGSLPGRPRMDPSLDALREVPAQEKPQSRTVEVETITPRAEVIVGWRAADWTAVKERRTLQIAAQIMNHRLREEIREKQGLTYSIFCFASPSQAYRNASYLGAYFTADPDKIEGAAAIARGIMQKFAEEGPTDEEMETVHKQFRNDIEEGQKKTGYWSGVLSDLDYHGTKLADVKEALEKYTTYTREDLLESLRKYLVEKGQIQVIALPKKSGGAAGGDAEGKKE